MKKSKKNKCPFKKLSLVQFKHPEDYHLQNPGPSGYPFVHDEIVLFLGEVEQMPGHCVVVGSKGKVYWGYHTENFVKPDEDKI